MAAKLALLSTLTDPSIDSETLLPTALDCAREHHMGTQPLTKIWREFSDQPEVSQPKDATVESIVADIVDLFLAKREGTNFGEGEPGESKEPPSFPNTNRYEPEPSYARTDAAGLDVSVDVRASQSSNDGTIGIRKNANGTRTISQDAETQANLLPSAEDFNEMTASFRQMRVSFLEFQVEFADQEQRYLRKIQELSRKVDDLTSTLNLVRREAKESEEKLTKKVKDLTSKLGEVSAQMKAPRPSSPKSSTKDSPKSSTKDRSTQVETSQKRPTQVLTQDHDQTNTPHEISETAEWIVVQPRPRRPAQTAWPSANPNFAPLSDHSATASSKSFNQQTQPTENQPRADNTSIRNNKSQLGLKGSNSIKKSVFFIGGLDLETTVEQVSGYCAERQVRVSSCRLLPSKRFGTRAARISVATSDAESAGLLKNEFWPEHISARPWSFNTQ